MNSFLYIVLLAVTLAPLVPTDAQTELNIPDNLGKRFVVGFGPNSRNEEEW